MRFMVNGEANMPGGGKFWRIDDIESGKTGLEFLARPAVLVNADLKGEGLTAHALALAIADLLNGQRPLGAGQSRTAQEKSC